MNLPTLVLFSLMLGLLSLRANGANLVAVTTANVNVRSSPGGSVNGTLPRGTTIGVIGAKDGWAQVVYLDRQDSIGKHGWISSNYLRLARPSPSVRRGITGDHCDSEYKTGSEVCVSVSDTSVDCSESYDGSQYDSCEVTLDYDVTTDYAGHAYLDVDVSCEVEISYSGRKMYMAGSDSDSQDENHSLYAYGSESNSMSFDFSFGPFDEVNRAEIDSARCEITNVNLW